jgi:Zn-dependent protease with chaperone function
VAELFEFIFHYWLSLLPLTVLSGTFSAIGLLSVVFQFKKTASKLRARLLTWIFTLNILGWSFVAISLALCGLFVMSNGHNYQIAIRNIVGEAFTSSLLIALPVSLLAKRRASETLLGRLPGRKLAAGDLASNFQSLASKMGVPRTRLYLADLPTPTSMAASGKSSVVILSRSLLKLLTPEELPTVLAHELAHIRNGDSFLKTLAVVYRRFLPVDPVLRLLEPAIHREREFFADEVSARVTSSPLQLASALIKIHEAYSVNVSVGVSGLSIIGGSRGFLSRHPPLKDRVERLLRMDDILMVE